MFSKIVRTIMGPSKRRAGANTGGGYHQSPSVAPDWSVCQNKRIIFFFPLLLGGRSREIQDRGDQNNNNIPISVSLSFGGKNTKKIQKNTYNFNHFRKYPPQTPLTREALSLHTKRFEDEYKDTWCRLVHFFDLGIGLIYA